LSWPVARELGIEWRAATSRRIRHVGITVGAIGLRPLAAHIEGDESVELAGAFPGLDVAKLEAGRRIDRAVDARPRYGRQCA